MLDFTVLNWWAILAATAVAFALGGLWYGPLFGKAWVAALGKTEDEIQPSPTPFVISFFAAALTAVVLGAIIDALVIDTLVGGLVIGLIVGIGFIATSMASDCAFCGWGVRLWAIQSGYRVIYSIMMGGILGAWT